MTQASAEERYSFGIYEKAMPPGLHMREKLQAASRHGYDFMELSIDESDEKLARLNASAQWKRELADAIRDTNIRIPTMCLSGHRKFPLGSSDQALRVRGMEIMKAAIRTEADLGIRIVEIAGYDVYYEPSTAETGSFFAENLAKSVEYAACYGVCLAFETMETPFMNTVEKALEFVKSINSPYLQLYPDVGNVTNAFQGDTPRVVQDLRCGNGHIVAVHLKETKPGIFREVSYGRGHVDFDACVAETAKAGARMFTSEFWYSPDVDWEAEMEKSFAFLHSKLERAFSGEI